MNEHIFIFGMGYTAGRIARTALLSGWRVSATVTSPEKAATLAALGFDMHVFTGGGASAAMEQALASASQILSSVPPPKDANENGSHRDPVLTWLEPRFEGLRPSWVGYLSSTGVYGDQQGAWVDETMPTGGGTRSGRDAADRAWYALKDVGMPIHVFRLPGIYGPGRSALERAQSGQMSRVDKPGHVFSRIHVDDIVRSVRISMDHPTPGEIYNVADDEPAPGYIVEDEACDLLDITKPPLVPYEKAALSPMGKAFYSQCRRVGNVKLKEMLGTELLYPTYREGLRACLAVRDVSM